MLILTLHVALSTLSFLYKSPVLLPKIEAITEFENSWKANFNLAVAMSKDNRVAETLSTADWKKLQNVSSSLDGKASPSFLFSVLEEILNEHTVEARVKTYPEYLLALVATKELAITITEDFRHLEMTKKNWRQLLGITRMEATPRRDLEIQYSADCTAICDKQINYQKQCLELVNTDLIELRDLFRDLIPTTTENAIVFLRMGFLLKLPSLSSKCSKFLEEALSMENAVQIFQAAGRTQMRDLIRRSEEDIFWEFEDISKRDTNFLSLRINELVSFLMSGKINVPNEISVFEAIERWIMADLNSREEHVAMLMKTVRFHLCSVSQLNKMLDHHLLAGLDSVQESIRTVIYLVQTDSPKLPELVQKEQRHLHETIFAIGGSGTNQASITVETFSPLKQQWIYHPSLNNGTNGATSVVAVGQTIVVFDHFRYTVSSFDPIKKVWKFLSTVANGRKFYSVAELNGEIYVLGGSTGEYTNICERFNPKTGVWTKIPYLNTVKQFHAASALQGKIYLAGGYEDSDYLRTFEMFDPERNSWQALAPLNFARARFALVTDGHYLWAFGGYSGQSLSSVERYEPGTDTWKNMPEIPTPRVLSGVAFMSGNFYIMGGGEYAYGKRVDVYNPRKKTWTRSSDMNFERFQYDPCVVKDLPNAYDYA